MRVFVKVTVVDEDRRFMGPGAYQLLTLTSELGSLRQASMQMGMSYSKAHAIVKRAERALGGPLLKSRTGGANGGGAELTPLGRKVLAAYDVMRQSVNEVAEQAFLEFCRSVREED